MPVPLDGDKLRSLRKKKGWGQDDLAAEAGISRSAVAKYEASGTTSVRPDTFKLLLKALGETEACMLQPDPPASQGIEPTNCPSLQESRGRRESGETGSEEDLLIFRQLPALTGKVVGREKELAALDDAWQTRNCNIISLVAWGGVGKSALVSAWWARMASAGWMGARRAFAWTFYKQGVQDTEASAILFLEKALAWFGDSTSFVDEGERGHKLAALICQHRTLLVLDGLEPFQSPEQGELKDNGLKALLGDLASHNPGLCLLTTRYPVANLEHYKGLTYREQRLCTLAEEAGAELIRVLLSKTTLGPMTDEAVLRRASKEFGGHALALNLLGTYVRDRWDGDLALCLKDDDLALGSRRKIEVQLLNDDQEMHFHPKRMLSSYERWFRDKPELLAVLRIVGLYDRTACEQDLQALCQAPVISGLTELFADMPRSQWRAAVRRLREAHLLEPSDTPDALDAHPLVREYFSLSLREHAMEAWREGHARLYGHLIATARDTCSTFEDLVPLYAAMVHGCHAGRHQDALKVYRNRVIRGDMFRTEKIGALGADFAALYHFFEAPFHKIVPMTKEEEIFVFRQTGYCLRAQGRLVDALACLGNALTLLQATEDKATTATVAGLISHIHLSSGNLQMAIERGSQAIAFADDGQDLMDQVKQRTALAYIKYQAGLVGEAKEDFAVALGRWDDLKKTSKLADMQYDKLAAAELLILYHYGDFLLGHGEHGKVIQMLRDGVSAFGEASSRSLAVALVCCVIGSAFIDKSLSDKVDVPVLAGEYLHKAVVGVRSSNRDDCLPLVLLARSRYFLLMGPSSRAAAWEDINLAFRTIYRGGMSLYEVDANLASARGYLLDAQDGVVVALEKAHKNLVRAKSLIATTQYHRRDAELDVLLNLWREADARRIRQA